MTKLEKVIRGLEAHANPKMCETCSGEDCPYYNMGNGYTEVTCSSFLAADALDLLKEQEEGVTPIESTTEQKKFADRIGFAVSEYWCGDCHFNLFNRPKFCPNCGMNVKWDD